MNEWWRAGGYVGAGLLAGLVAAVAARTWLTRPGRREVLRHASKPAAALLFWLFVAAGLVAAVASTSPETLDPIPSDILAWLPRVGVAGLVTIAGYVFATVASGAIHRVAVRATGRTQPVVQTTVRVAIMGAAGVLALSQLGIDTTILNILVAAVAFGIALALAGLATVGGQHTARSVAAGATIADLVQTGNRVTIGTYTGTVENVTPTHLVLTGSDDELIVVPLSLTDHLAVVIHER